MPTLEVPTLSFPAHNDIKEENHLQIHYNDEICNLSMYCDINGTSLEAAQHDSPSSINNCVQNDDNGDNNDNHNNNKNKNTEMAETKSCNDNNRLHISNGCSMLKSQISQPKANNIDTVLISHASCAQTEIISDNVSSLQSTNVNDNENKDERVNSDNNSDNNKNGDNDKDVTNKDNNNNTSDIENNENIKVISSNKTSQHDAPNTYDKNKK